MHTQIRFPFGRFTPAEWLAAFAISLPPDEAAREAAYIGSDAPRLRSADVELATLAFLALVSSELAARVEAYRREDQRRRRARAARAAEEDRYWRGVVRSLEDAFGRGPRAGAGPGARGA